MDVPHPSHSKPGAAGIRLQRPGAGGEAGVSGLAILRPDNDMDSKPVSGKTPHNPQSYLRVSDDREDATSSILLNGVSFLYLLNTTHG